MTSTNPYIAVVDDEASVRIALGRLLRLADYEVALFACGEEFLASLEARRPACAILDVHMPGASGFQVQAMLRAARIGPPIVFISASDDPALEPLVLAAGGVRLLRKPFSSAELLEAIELALGVEPNEPS